MNELIDKAYAYVEQTLAENLARHETVISKTKRYVRYDRFYHIQRVTVWANRICDELCSSNAVGMADAIDRECLHLASVLHDVGYNAYHISGRREKRKDSQSDPSAFPQRLNVPCGYTA